MEDRQVKGQDELRLTISPSDDEKLAPLLDGLKDDALRRDSKTRYFSIELLLNSHAPAAVRPIQEFLAKSSNLYRQEFGAQAVDALGGIETIESVQALTEIALSKDVDENDDLVKRAVEMVYRIADRAVDKLDLRDACQPVIRARPRPTLPDGIVD